MRSLIASLRSLVLPFGATSPPRIVLDGVNGRIECDGADGSKIIIEVVPGIGAAVETNPPDYPGVVYGTGKFYSQQVPADGSQPQAVVQSPNINSPSVLLASEITLIGEGVGGAPSRIDFSTALVTVSGPVMEQYVYYDSGSLDQGPFIGTGFNDIAGLDNIPVGAGETWTYELHVAHTGSAGGGGKFAWNLAGGAITMDRTNFGEPTSSSTPADTNVFLGRKTAGTTQPVGGGAAAIYTEFGRIVNNGAAGTITLRAGENVASTGFTVHARSWFQRRRVA